MLALFAILGTLGLASALYGLIGSIRSKRPLLIDFAVMGALAIAWWIGHASVIGWAALVIGAAASIFRLNTNGGAKTPPEPVADESDAAPRPADAKAGAQPTIEDAKPIAPAQPLAVPAATKPPSPKPAPGPPQVYKTIALMRDPLQTSLDVLCASLRRGGERRAEVRAATQSGSPAHIAIGPIRLDVLSNPTPLDRRTIEDAAGQSVDWPDALTAVGPHQGHVTLSTTTARYEPDGDMSRDAVIRTHLQAHAALSEFAPVIGVLWPSSGLLVQREAVGRLLTEPNVLRRLSATGLGFRATELDGELTGCHCCGTAGLTDLGLRDIEIVVEAEPDDAITSAMVRMVRRIFEHGESADGTATELPEGETEWIAEAKASHLPPTRTIVRFSRKPAEASAEEDAAT